MPETVINWEPAPELWSQTGLQINLVAVDTANGNAFEAADNVVVVVHNTDSVSQAVRFTSQPHPETGRTGDINQSIPAGDFWMFHFTKQGWEDVNGNILMPSGQSNLLKVAVVRF